MNINMTRRSFIRIISFIIALLIVLTSFVYIYVKDSTESKRSLEYHYKQSIDDLTLFANNINSSLTKATFVSTPEMMTSLSTKLWNESVLAKQALDNLPISYEKLESTNKLLAQIGNFCLSMSKAYANGDEITQEQRDMFKTLSSYCDEMAREILIISDEVRAGGLSLNKVKTNINKEFNGTTDSGNITDSFNNFDEGLSEYPTLIYDGPFSDHLQQKESQILANSQEVSIEEAMEKAKIACGTNDIEQGEDENSRMPAYSFSGNGIDCTVTKQGGFISYMLRSGENHDIETQKFDDEQCIAKANEYLLSLGIEGMEKTYYETDNNIITINYAHVQQDVMMYPDLIKVSVSKADGSITGFDSRGYLINNVARDETITGKTVYDMEDAQSILNPTLTVESARKCVIPSTDLKEVLTFEFKCKAEDGTDVLVYINANTLDEEQLLLLVIDDNGVLTV